jgi:hypothetical protein
MIRTLWNLEMNGNILFFISNFIRNRPFRVLIGDTLSDVHSQENGIVQRRFIERKLISYRPKKHHIPGKHWARKPYVKSMHVLKS